MTGMLSHTARVVEEAQWFDGRRAPAGADSPDPGLPVVLVAAEPSWTDHGAVRSALIEAWRTVGRPVRFVTCTLDGAPGPASVVGWFAGDHEVCGIEYGRVLAWPWRHAVRVVVFGSPPGVVGRMVQHAADAGIPVDRYDGHAGRWAA